MALSTPKRMVFALIVSVSELISTSSALIGIIYALMEGTSALIELVYAPIEKASALIKVVYAPIEKASALIQSKKEWMGEFIPFIHSHNIYCNSTVSSSTSAVSSAASSFTLSPKTERSNNSHTSYVLI